MSVVSARPTVWQQINLRTSFLILGLVLACHMFALQLLATETGTIAGWGRSPLDTAHVPLGLTNIVSVAAGEDHALALRNDHTVVAWGDNTQGQGNIPVGLTNVLAVAAGIFHNLVLLTGG